MFTFIDNLSGNVLITGYSCLFTRGRWVRFANNSFLNHGGFFCPIRFGRGLSISAYWICFRRVQLVWFRKMFPKFKFCQHLHVRIASIKRHKKAFFILKIKRGFKKNKRIRQCLKTWNFSKMPFLTSSNRLSSKSPDRNLSCTATVRDSSTSMGFVTCKFLKEIT